ncbi:PREDICTED: probable protein phosphatase 2C 72 isoform X2 [Tarenaya hassleriana]|uniref:probable protein phosphatase 2C 72 isoform X2 n=1 Tax=Tarenaya hassleriana TaxID=28532 RepID=UPI00053C0CA1|nr:PREDICTED: probable protein phosphatase 2C 72 isoform X2 [Tarenaya hassleriana]
MGHCFSVSSSEIHEENEFSDGNTMVCYGEESGLGDDGPVWPSGSVWSIQGSKGLNQDAAVLYLGYGRGEGEMCGVFDGHGKSGHLVSKMVRNRLPSLLLTFKNQSPDDDDDGEWEEACLSAFRLIDRELLLQTFDCSFSGTTAVIAIRQGNDLVLANLGDSRAVLGTVSEDGELGAVQLTTDLKPGVPREFLLLLLPPSLVSGCAKGLNQYRYPEFSCAAGEEERITRCNGRVFALKAEPYNPRVWLPNRDVPGLAMSRAFGDFVLKDYGIIAVPEVSHRRLTPNDQFLVLATDGVWDVLSNDEVVSIVSSERKPASAAKLVAETAKAAWKKKKLQSTKVDDITVACLFLQKQQDAAISGDH